MPWTEDQERAAQARRRLWRISGLGTELFASIVGAFLLGWLIDHWTNRTDDLFKLIGLAVGLIGGGWNFYKAVRTLRAEDAEDTHTNPPRRTPATPTQSTHTPPDPGLPPPPVPPATRAPPSPRAASARESMFESREVEPDALDAVDRDPDLRWPEQDDPDLADPPPDRSPKDPTR